MMIWFDRIFCNIFHAKKTKLFVHGTQNYSCMEYEVHNLVVHLVLGFAFLKFVAYITLQPHSGCETEMKMRPENAVQNQWRFISREESSYHPSVI